MMLWTVMEGEGYVFWRGYDCTGGEVCGIMKESFIVVF